jgi:hypothetical protein
VTQVGLAGMRSGTALGMESIFLELLVSVKVWRVSRLINGGAEHQMEVSQSQSAICNLATVDTLNTLDNLSYVRNFGNSAEC